jgi:hypothetical protein
VQILKRDLLNLKMFQASKKEKSRAGGSAALLNFMYLSA